MAQHAQISQARRHNDIQFIAPLCCCYGGCFFQIHTHTSTTHTHTHTLGLSLLLPLSLMQRTVEHPLNFAKELRIAMGVPAVVHFYSWLLAGVGGSLRVETTPPHSSESGCKPLDPKALGLPVAWPYVGFRVRPIPHTMTPATLLLLTTHTPDTHNTQAMQASTVRHSIMCWCHFSVASCHVSTWTCSQ